MICIGESERLQLRRRYLLLWLKVTFLLGIWLLFFNKELILGVSAQDSERIDFNPFPTAKRDNNNFNNNIVPIVRQGLRQNSSVLNFWIMAPEIVQPDSIYKVIVSTFGVTDVETLDVRLSIFKDGADIYGASKLLSVGDTESLILQIPQKITRGEYRLRVEGNYPKSQGGTIFVRESNLTFSEKFLSVIIQPNRHVYNGGQKIRFRVILLKRNLLPYGHQVDIYILDSRGFIMRRWPSVPSLMGVVSITYELPPYTNLGKWTIQVHVGSQIEEKTIRVERYFQPLYEVIVSMDPFIMAEADTVKATVVSFYGTEKAVNGNATVTLLARNDDRIDDWITIDVETFYLRSDQEFEWKMVDISQYLDFSKGVTIRVEGLVTDFFIGEPRFGFAESRIIKESLQVNFINSAPLVFKPGLSFQTYLRVSYSDQEKVPSEILKGSHIRVHTEAVLENGGRVQLPIIEVRPESYIPSIEFNQRVNSYEFDPQASIYQYYYEKHKFESYWTNGILPVKVSVPKRTSRLILKADYTDAEQKYVATETQAFAFYSPSGRCIQAVCTSSVVAVSEYAVIQFKANFLIDKFHYIVLAKGLILQDGIEEMPNVWSSTKTFTVVVSPEMAPAFRLLVFCITRTGELISDTVFIPVHKYTRHSMELILNQNKDRSKDTVEAKFYGEPGAYFATSVHRSVRYFMQAGNEISKGSVLERLLSLEPSRRRINRVLSRSRSGESPDEIEYFQTFNTALDSHKAFNQSGIIAFTEEIIPTTELYVECESEELCSTHNCFSYIDHCGRIKHCQDRRRILECEQSETELIDFRVERVNHFIDFFDASDGDWAWSNEIIPHGGEFDTLFQVPKVTDNWHVNAFAISPKHGFAILDAPLNYDTKRPFLMTVDSPSYVRRGEQFGIITMLYNHTPKDIFASIFLQGSSDYSFVQAGRYGDSIFKDGEPQFTNGEHQHFVWIPANGQLEVRIPIKPLIDQGTVEVTVTATTQIRSDTATISVDVLAEGVQIGKHTSMILDLKNRATVLKFMNIFVEETPEVPYELTRKYIYGTTSAHVTLYGDILGPIFPSTPVNMNALLGKEGKGTADRLFDLSVSIWSLHYLRLTNQLENSVARKVFVEMNKVFAQIMKRFRPVGYFKMWNLSKPSVWLSAWALTVFAHGSFQDWENYFYVEDRIFSRVTKWILRHQQLDGTFSESYLYSREPLHKRMCESIEPGIPPFNVSLTAHVVIMLHHVVAILEGPLKVEATLAKAKAILYLEQHLTEIADPFQMAISAYALTLADSVEKDTAFGRLFVMRREDAGFLYWSAGVVPTNEIIYENNRPFTQPKNNELWDSYAVQTTSYGLMTCLMRDGVVTPMTEQIVLWLNTMKLTDGSFISSIDTALTFQAMTEYANRARLRDVTELAVTIEVSSSAESSRRDIFINANNIAEIHTIDVTDVWGHINIIAKGSGQAVVQLDLTFGIDWEEFKDTPPKDCFELTIREFYSEEWNKTALTVESCFRWILLEESPVSGAAVLDVEIPTGYGLLQSDALDLVASGIHPTLRDALMSPGKTSWYFDHVTSEMTCFNHTVRRWYPVANLTAYKQATLYESYALERFVNTFYYDLSMRDLTICEVCGSFQCPYCPFYSRSQPAVVIQFRVLLIPIVIFFSSLFNIFIII